jgi:hypothetical protein
MKKMKHVITAAIFGAVLLLAGNKTYAQTKEVAGDSKALRLGIGLSLGIPTNDFYSFAVGGDLRLQKDLSSNLSAIGSVGYNSFIISNELIGAGSDNSAGFIPVKVGLKVFPVERFYFSGEVGAGFPTADNAKTAFIYAPGLGFGFNNGLDLGLRYEGMSASRSNLGQIALRIAYGFKL